MEGELDMANLTNPVKHQADDTGAWRKKWLDDRKPQALVVGAQGAAEAKLTVKHDIKDQKELEFFKKHVSKMEEKGKRKEMGAQNMPF
jgi:hypothetical protein